jgi:hypothetical protein
MKNSVLLFAVLPAFFVGACATKQEAAEKAPAAVGAGSNRKSAEASVSKDRGPIGILVNGVLQPPKYETGSPSSTTGYVKVYLSKTSPTPPATTWYLDGASKGRVTAYSSAGFRSTNRTGHTVSFTCLGNNKPPLPVQIDLLPYQKVTIPIYYQ